MHKFGLKLWSTNQNYIDEAVRLFDQGVYQYIEMYVVPSSFSNCSKMWKALRIPYVVHAPHFREKMNLAKKENKELNLKLAKETIRFANDLNSEIIIFHPGIAGDVKETVNQLQQINDSRIIIENKPYYALDDGLICNGHSPEEIEYIMNNANVGFCLDLGHAICSANAKKIKQSEYLKQFVDLNPKIFHMTDGDYAGVYDKHSHFGAGNFNINYLLNKIPKGSCITIETIKSSNESLNDFVGDINYIKDRCFVISLVTEDDLMDVYNLSNDQIVRNNSFNPETIKLDDHIQWYKNKIKDPNSVFYIIRSMDGKFIGQVRLEEIKDSRDCVVGISICDKYRGKGLSSSILKDSITKFLETKSISTDIYAYIKKDNAVSIKSFSKAGFSLVGQELVENSESYKLRYDNESLE
jgi:deoxyribonuclease IV